MERQLFLHHYFPALYFAVLALCQGWDYLTTRQRFLVAPRRASQITLVFLAVIIGVYVALQPLAYGGKWTKSLCEKTKVFDTWDFDCNTFYQDVPPLPPH
jgi:dolichyl-phosphate-mannose-protein mannosyltransferase